MTNPWKQVIIPGEPFPQGRHRCKNAGAFASAYEPKESKSWKGMAQVHMLNAGHEMILEKLPIEIHIIGVFPCRTALKKSIRPRKWYLGSKDFDNIAKIVCDAGSTILWVDDRYICEARITVIVGEQNEPARVVLKYREMDCCPPSRSDEPWA